MRSGNKQRLLRAIRTQGRRRQGREKGGRWGGEVESKQASLHVDCVAAGRRLGRSDRAAKEGEVENGGWGRGGNTLPPPGLSFGIIPYLFVGVRWCCAVACACAATVQSVWLQWDIGMNDQSRPDGGMMARTSNLNEELGMVGRECRGGCPPPSPVVVECRATKRGKVEGGGRRGEGGEEKGTPRTASSPRVLVRMFVLHFHTLSVSSAHPIRAGFTSTQRSLCAEFVYSLAPDGLHATTVRGLFKLTLDPQRLRGIFCLHRVAPTSRHFVPVPDPYHRWSTCFRTRRGP